jgi:flagellar biosynthesis/type III secretory pathway protein FliH
MADDEITNRVLLEHMQGMKHELQQQIQGLRNDLQKQISALDVKVTDMGEEMRQNFRMLQEDLEETMRVQARHGARLAKMKFAES